MSGLPDTEETVAAVRANANRYIANGANDAINVIADFVPLIESSTELAEARRAQALLVGIRDTYHRGGQ